MAGQLQAQINKYAGSSPHRLPLRDLQSHMSEAGQPYATFLVAAR